MDTVRADPSLDGLEADVLSRIAGHRESMKARSAVPVALFVAFTALAGGLLTGISEPHRHGAGHGSEAALLADEVRLAPSTLLASNQ
jgi:hypothetical protein